MSGFEVNRALLNPRFEAYRLIEDSDDVGLDSSRATERSFALPGSTLSSSSGLATPLGFKELKDRSRHSYLAAGFLPNQAAYIDGNGYVILVTFDEEDLHPTYHPIHRISTSVKELPSLIAIDEERWLVSDGNGLLSLLCISQLQSSSRWSGNIAQTWKLGGQQEPFKLLSARRLMQEGFVQVVLQRTKKSEHTVARQPGLGGSRNSASTRSTAQTTFEIILTQVQLAEKGHEDSNAEEPSAIELKVDGIFSSDEPCLFADQDDTFVHVASEAPIQRHISAKEVDEPPPEKRARPSSEDAVQAKSAHQNGSTTASEQVLRPPPPYSWTQTSETVTVVFMLPSTVEKRDVRCRFSSQNLDLELVASASLDTAPRIVELSSDDRAEEEASRSEILPAAQELQEGRYMSRKLRAVADADGSVWTWEKVHRKSAQKDGQVGLLALHLEKARPGSRWTSVFEDEEEDEVPETLDPTALLDVLEGNGSDGLAGIEQPQASSLLQDGLEEEDATVGKPCFVLQIRTSSPSEAVTMTATTKDYGPGPLMCLATPLPTSSNVSSPATELVLKRDLDGLVYAPEPSSRDGWTHVETFPALAYVLASKRDAQRTYVFSRKVTNSSAARSVVLAFENAPAVEEERRRHAGVSTGAGNLFVYYTPEKQDSTGGQARYNNTSQSRVIRLGTSLAAQTEETSSFPSSGPLVSVAAVQMKTIKGKEDVLVCLCQQRLLLLQNVL